MLATRLVASFCLIGAGMLMIRAKHRPRDEQEQQAVVLASRVASLPTWRLLLLQRGAGPPARARDFHEQASQDTG